MNTSAAAADSPRGLPGFLGPILTVWSCLGLPYVGAVLVRLFWPKGDLRTIEDFAFNWHQSGIGLVVVLSRFVAVAYVSVGLVLAWPHLLSRNNRPDRWRCLSMLAAGAFGAMLLIEWILRGNS